MHQPKKWSLKGYRHSVNLPQTSPTPPLPRKNVQHACCTLYSMPSLYTVWCGNQCSVLCVAYYAVVRPCIICILVMQTPTVRYTVPQYRNVSAVVNLRVVGTCCQTSCTTCTCTTMGLYSHCSTVTLRILHFAGGFPVFHTLYNQPFGPSARLVFICTEGHELSRL